jgi:putative membrane protein
MVQPHTKRPPFPGRRRRPRLRATGADPDPRFTLANERTFLAWNRTALALLASGLAVAHLLPSFGFPGARTVIAVALLVLGAVAALRSFPEWEERERALREQRPLPPSRLPRMVAIGITVIILVATAATVIEG